MRVVIELKRDAIGRRRAEPALPLHALQTTFGVNMLALNGGRPEQLNLKDMIEAFIDFREEVVTRRTSSCSQGARARATSWSASPSPSPTSTR